MTFGNLDPPPNFKVAEIIFEYYQCAALKIPEILRYYMIFTCKLIFQPIAALHLQPHLTFTDKHVYASSYASYD